MYTKKGRVPHSRFVLKQHKLLVFTNSSEFEFHMTVYTYVHCKKKLVKSAKKVSKPIVLKMTSLFFLIKSKHFGFNL